MYKYHVEKVACENFDVTFQRKVNNSTTAILGGGNLIKNTQCVTIVKSSLSNTQTKDVVVRRHEKPQGGRRKVNKCNVEIIILK